MKRTVLSLILSAAVLSAIAAPVAFAQSAGQQRPRLRGYFKVKPLTGTDHEALKTALSSGTTIPLWTYTLVATKDGNPYAGEMVGRSPFFHGFRTTSINTVIVPVILKMPDGGVFDPTATDTRCLSAPNDVPLSLIQQSPMVQSASFTMNGVNVGSTPYFDAFQRAAFWSNISSAGNSYHTLLNVTTLAAVTVNVPLGSGQTYSAASLSTCGPEGVMDINYWDPYVQGTLIPSLSGDGVGPNSFPIFVFYNVVMAEGDTNIFVNCCILGYHGAFTNGSGLLQTYSPLDFDTSAFNDNTSVMSHEIGEWMDDPTGGNATPNWGGEGQVVGTCQGNLEVGDPLSPGFGTATSPYSVTMSNGFTYTLQELAFFSWYFNSTTTPSLGAGGKFSDHATFKGASKACPPGGTN